MAIITNDADEDTKLGNKDHDYFNDIMAICRRDDQLHCISSFVAIFVSRTL